MPGAGNSSLATEHISRSPFATYYTFMQEYQNIPVHGTMVKVAVGKSGKIQSINGSYFQTYDWPHFPEHKKTDLPEAFMSSVDNETIIEQRNKIIVGATGTPSLLTEFDLIDKNHNTHRTLIIDDNGEVLEDDDHRVYFTAGDSLVTGKVFLPDPLTSAGVVYGGDFTDMEDADNAALNDQRFEVEFNAWFENDTFFLKTDSLLLKDINAPTIPVAYSITPSFDFLRSEDGFEDVNVFYHLTNFNAYIKLLGYDALQHIPLSIDTHGASGADQSFYTGGANPAIQYGEGGVDDAEDADVILHEYGHALSDYASPGSNLGLERHAIDEAYGDYFAVSYSRGFSDFNWGDVFSWDGHNEFWAGRNADTEKHYPEDNGLDYYGSSEIWSGALMDIFDAIGKENTDLLVIEALYGSFPNMTMPDAAQLILSAETTIFTGTFHDLVYAKLYERGLIAPDAIDSPSNNTMHLFPNPAHSVIQIMTNDPAPFSVIVTDITGKQVLAFDDVIPGQEINIASLQNGIYTVTIQTGDSIRKTEKLVIIR